MRCSTCAATQAPRVGRLADLASRPCYQALIGGERGRLYPRREHARKLYGMRTGESTTEPSEDPKGRCEAGERFAFDGSA